MRRPKDNASADAVIEVDQIRLSIWSLDLDEFVILTTTQARLLAHKLIQASDEIDRITPRED